MTFRVSKSDQKRQGAVVTRERVEKNAEEKGWVEKMAPLAPLEILLDLLDVRTDLGTNASLMLSVKQGRWAVVSRTEAKKDLRNMGQESRRRLSEVCIALRENWRRHATSKAGRTSDSDAEGREVHL